MLFILLVLSTLLTNCFSQLLGLHEGEKCRSGGWSCQRLDRCKALGDFKTAHPQICSFDDSTPIVCCPPPSTFHNSTADANCRVYGMIICSRKRRGFRRRGKRHIVGGIRARPREHKHMALIGYGEKSSIEWQCGGSIISPNFILSAAHCAESPNLGVAKWARVGELDTSSTSDDDDPEDIPIIQRIIHPSYNPPRMYHDIALFKLEIDLEFSQWVAPACLATQALLPQTKATATGWGRTGIANDVSPHLLEVNLTLVDSEECKQLLGRNGRIPSGIDSDTMICAGEKEGGKDACSGDSGGPLVINSTQSCLKTQIGVISFGRLCGLPNTPGVYTRVYHYLPWIESVIWS